MPLFGLGVLITGVLITIWGVVKLRKSNPDESPESDDALPAVVEAEILETGKAELSTSNPVNISRTLAGKGAIKRASTERRITDVAKRTTRIITTQTETMKTQAEQIKTFLSESNAIEKLKNEGELLPLEKEVQASELETKLTENQLRQAELRKRMEDLKKPDPEPGRTEERPKERKLTREEKANNYREEHEGTVADIKAAKHPPEIEARLLRRAQEKYEDKLNELYS